MADSNSAAGLPTTTPSNTDSRDVQHSTAVSVVEVATENDDDEAQDAASSEADEESTAPTDNLPSSTTRDDNPEITDEEAERRRLNEEYFARYSTEEDYLMSRNIRPDSAPFVVMQDGEINTGPRHPRFRHSAQSFREARDHWNRERRSSELATVTTPEESAKMAEQRAADRVAEFAIQSDSESDSDGKSDGEDGDEGLLILPSPHVAYRADGEADNNQSSTPRSAPTTPLPWSTSVDWDEEYEEYEAELLASSSGTSDASSSNRPKAAGPAEPSSSSSNTDMGTEFGIQDHLHHHNSDEGEREASLYDEPSPPSSPTDSDPENSDSESDEDAKEDDLDISPVSPDSPDSPDLTSIVLPSSSPFHDPSQALIANLVHLPPNPTFDYPLPLPNTSPRFYTQNPGPTPRPCPRAHCPENLTCPICLVPPHLSSHRFDYRPVRYSILDILNAFGGDGPESVDAYFASVFHESNVRLLSAEHALHRLLQYFWDGRGCEEWDKYCAKIYVQVQDERWRYKRERDEARAELVDARKALENCEKSKGKGKQRETVSVDEAEGRRRGETWMQGRVRMAEERARIAEQRAEFAERAVVIMQERVEAVTAGLPESENDAESTTLPDDEPTVEAETDAEAETSTEMQVEAETAPPPPVPTRPRRCLGSSQPDRPRRRKRRTAGQEPERAEPEPRRIPQFPPFELKSLSELEAEADAEIERKTEAAPETEAEAVAGTEATTPVPTPKILGKEHKYVSHRRKHKTRKQRTLEEELERAENSDSNSNTDSSSGSGSNSDSGSDYKSDSDSDNPGHAGANTKTAEKMGEDEYTNDGEPQTGASSAASSSHAADDDSVTTTTSPTLLDQLIALRDELHTFNTSHATYDPSQSPEVLALVAHQESERAAEEASRASAKQAQRLEHEKRMEQMEKEAERERKRIENMGLTKEDVEGMERFEKKVEEMGRVWEGVRGWMERRRRREEREKEHEKREGK